MDREERERALRRVLCDVFDVSESDIVDDLSPDTLDSWTSLSHIALVAALEETFGVKFENSEIMDMTNVAVIRELVAARLSPP